MTLWSGRIAAPMSDAMTAMNQSLMTDIRMLPHDLRLNRAWAWELHRINILDASEFDAIEKALNTIFDAFQDPTFGATLVGLTDEDVHSYVERRVVELAGDAGKKIHTGRSRNDQVMTALRLYLKEHLTLVVQQTTHAIHACVAQAKVHKTTTLPGYTHMQQAQPISLAHYLLSAATVLQEDYTRMAAAMERMDYCPLGSGALGGSAYPIDRKALAESLAFAGPTTNSIASISMRDECLEVASVCAILMTHLSRYAEDWILWSSQEFGFLTLSDALSTGSSMMPQKKNPDSLELIRGKCARVIGHMQTLFTLMKGLPLTYARDLQEDKPAIFDCLDQTLLSLSVFTEVVTSATFHPEAMFVALDANLYATEVADYLVVKGVPFRCAHEMVGGIVARCIAENKELTCLKAQDLVAMLPKELERFAPAFQDDLQQCFDPEIALMRRNLTGGTGPQSVAAQFDAFENWLKSTQQ